MSAWPEWVAWTADEAGGPGWNGTGRTVWARSEKEAAETFAEQHCEKWEETPHWQGLVVFVAPAERPHRAPSTWPLKVDVTEGVETIVTKTVKVKFEGTEW